MTNAEFGRRNGKPRPGRWTVGAIALLFVCGPPRAAQGEVPQHFTLNVQAFQPDDPFGFSYQGPVKVELFDAAEDGNSLWSEVHQNLGLDYGFMSVSLGTVNTVTPLTEVLVENSQVPVFLEITLGETGETLPERIELTSVPFALACSLADSAYTLEGKSANEFALAEHEHTIAELTDWPGTFPPEAHNHDGVYLAAGDKAADADLLDGMDSTEFVSAGELAGVLADLQSNYYTASQLDDGQLDGRYYTKQQCEEMFAAKGETYTKSEVNDAVAGAIAVAAGPLQAQLWCLENCDPAKLMGCQSLDCNGAAKTCTESGPMPDGKLCQAETGVGACHDGVCKQSVLLCGGTPCPMLAGYTVSCNGKQHCEYANVDASGWKEWDVWIWIPPGEFQMGSKGEGGNIYETPVHPVTIAYGYFISKYEIVVKQYEACIANGDCSQGSTADWDGNGWGLNTSVNGRSDHPQNGITWQQAKDFCAWSAPAGRLPSEAEWEYAASGPSHLIFPWGDSPAPTCSNNTAVFNEAGGTGGYGCSEGGTWTVGSKTAGASWCGALDMSGSVWEWNEDWFHNSYTDAPADGSAWIDPTGSDRVVRGGGFDYVAGDIRLALRGTGAPGLRSANGGARCVRPLP